MRGVSLLLVLLICNPVFADNRVEELFLWKIAEELKLNVKEEKEVSQLVRDLNNKKLKLNQEMDQLINRAKDGKRLKELAIEYRRKINDYNQISIAEFDGIQKILGQEKTLKYFVVKNDLSQKIKQLLSGAPEKEKKPLPEPKVIEEK